MNGKKLMNSLELKKLDDDTDNELIENEQLQAGMRIMLALEMLEREEPDIKEAIRALHGTSVLLKKDVKQSREITFTDPPESFDPNQDHEVKFNTTNKQTQKTTNDIYNKLKWKPLSPIMSPAFKTVCSPFGTSSIPDDEANAVQSRAKITGNALCPFCGVADVWLSYPNDYRIAEYNCHSCGRKWTSDESIEKGE